MLRFLVAIRILTITTMLAAISFLLTTVTIPSPTASHPSKNPGARARAQEQGRCIYGTYYLSPRDNQLIALCRTMFCDAAEEAAPKIPFYTPLPIYRQEFISPQLLSPKSCFTHVIVSPQYRDGWGGDKRRGTRQMTCSFFNETIWTRDCAGKVGKYTVLYCVFGFERGNILYCAFGLKRVWFLNDGSRERLLHVMRTLTGSGDRHFLVRVARFGWLTCRRVIIGWPAK